MPDYLKKWWGVILKLGVTVAFVWLIANSIDVSAAWSRLAGAEPALVLLAGMGIFLQLAINAERWRRLGHVCGAFFTYRQGLRLYLESMFFNQALPSTVGGDALRIYRLRRNGTSLGASIQCVLLDRLAGLMGLVALILAGQPLFHMMVDDDGARWVFALIVAAGVGGFGMLACFHWLPKRLRANRVLAGLGTFGTYVRRLVSTPSVGIPVLLLAVCGHLFMVGSAWIMARSLGVPVDLVSCFVMVPAAILISMVPITIAGWGVREGAMVAAFALIGMAPADAVAWSILFGLVLVLIGLLGGLVWFLGGGTLASVQDGRG